MEGYEGVPVVKEIPIFISQELSNRLMVYQYPLEDCLRTDNASVLECTMKDDKEVTFELERDVQNANYSTSRGEQMALNVDGAATENLVFPRKIMDKQVLVSKVLPNKNLAVGLLHDGELHLTHAAGIALLRPSYRHLDQSDKRAKHDLKDKVEGEGTEEEEDEELQQVTVKFARPENERAKKNREKSFSYLSKQSAKQIWTHMVYHDANSVTAEVETGKFYCKHPNEKVGDSGPRGIARLDAMVGEEATGSCAQTRSSHGVSLTRLPGSLIDRIKTILISARVVDMGTLNRLLGLGADAGDVQDRIKVVQHVGVLVQGCWVLPSDIAIHKEATPCGVPSNLARSARDYILYQFTRSRTVTRSQLSEMIKIPGDFVKTLLEEVAVKNGKEWEFKLPTDVHFTLNYRDVEQRQQAKWELRLEQIVAGLKPAEMGAAPPTRNRRRSGRESISSDTETADARRHYPGSKMRRTARTSESRPPDLPT